VEEEVAINKTDLDLTLNQLGVANSQGRALSRYDCSMQGDDNLNIYSSHVTLRNSTGDDKVVPELLSSCRRYPIYRERALLGWMERSVIYEPRVENGWGRFIHSIAVAGITEFEPWIKSINLIRLVTNGPGKYAGDYTYAAIGLDPDSEIANSVRWPENVNPFIYFHQDIARFCVNNHVIGPISFQKLLTSFGLGLKYLQHKNETIFTVSGIWRKLAISLKLRLSKKLSNNLSRVILNPSLGLISDSDVALLERNRNLLN
jgi:hypothetical protein